ncbi:PREDICTED: UPF0481 protein At3g47200-like [Ipomoea nil]|uniref:UPF0481 protein At3g47200-like n=1 Tax=Ipomoea nil TaxID=35883 RepID=UPI00090112AC|nr:PREDICTED: UPF0481 protein At3g47200-like [Ipomoea nil]
MTTEASTSASGQIWNGLRNLGDPEYQRPIFKVHDILRNVNMTAYEPEIISIGPYHRENESLSAMEKHKLQYLNQLFDEKVKVDEDYVLQEMMGRVVGHRGDKGCDKIKEKICKNFLQELGELAMEARKKYAGSFSLNDEQFVNMLLLDGCFIIQLLLKNYSMPELITEDDPIFKVDWMRTSLQRDLLLLENQLPFGVLCKLFELIDHRNKPKDLAYHACRFFCNVFHGLDMDIPNSFQANAVEHLLDLIHSRWNPQLRTAPAAAVVDFPLELKENSLNWRFFSAKRIIENGVVFKISKSRGNLFDIKFSDKCCIRFSKLIFQQLIIEGRTETFFRNFIAYEQYFKASKGNFVTNYVDFFGNLIDSEEDVELLSYHGILDNKLGDSKSVVNLFTKINQCVTIENPEKSNSLYGHIYRQLNVYCTKNRHYYRAKMRESYCNPWGIASITLATMGIFLTVIMLAFAVLNYKFNKKQHQQPH